MEFLKLSARLGRLMIVLLLYEDKMGGGERPVPAPVGDPPPLGLRGRPATGPAASPPRQVLQTEAAYRPLPPYAAIRRDAPRRASQRPARKSLVGKI